MKRKLVLAILAVLFASGAVTVSPGWAAETITLKAITAWPKNSAEGNQSLDFFLESVEKQVAQKYPGELKINLVGGRRSSKSMTRSRRHKQHGGHCPYDQCLLRPLLPEAMR